MLDDCAVFGGFSPENIGETAGRAEHLHRFVIARRFMAADFRRKQVMRVSGVIEDQAIRFVRCEPQPASDNLLIQTDGFGRAQDGDKIHMRCVKAGGQHRYIHQIA
ncbi:hypothetical protein SRABI106_03190 [Rahnella aquatilis]|nr:hypothetical protein SRABI106_03190 [Rahnella aquatilis]